MSFYDELSKLYFNEITPSSTYSELCSIGNKISWYMADSQNNIVNAIGNNTNYIIDVDIKSAFPTLCQVLYPNTEFINAVNNAPNKKSKNIIIATTLKGEALRQLNRMCKIIILGIIFDTDNELEKSQIDIFELKKDGCLIGCSKQTIDRLNNIYYSENKFTQYIVKNNFSFHIDYFAKYIRCNRTSFLLGKNLDIDSFVVKGQHKYIAKELKKIMYNIILKNEYDIAYINKIYSSTFFKILKHNNLQKYLTDYYIVDRKIMNYEGKYVNFNLNVSVNPDLYKKIFIFPMIISNTVI